MPLPLIQDLLYKIPFIGKRKKPSGSPDSGLAEICDPGSLRNLPALAYRFHSGRGRPWFYPVHLCQRHLMAGLPLVTTEEHAAGHNRLHCSWKMAVLVSISALCFILQAFCKYLCPLGAICSPIPRRLLYRLDVDDQMHSLRKMPEGLYKWTFQ